MRSYYDVLGCSSTASFSELKKAYFDSLRAKHPDRSENKDSDFSAVLCAWSVLR